MAMVKRKHDDGHEVEYYIHDTMKEVLLDRAYEVVHHKNNSFVAVIDGRSGSGKTTTGVQYAKYLDPSFTINNVAWTPQRFEELISNAKKGACIMFDEGMIINSRSANSQVNKAIMIALSQIRSRNIFIFICINSIFDIDRNIALHRADGLIHVYTKDDKIDGEKRIKFYGRQKLKYLYILGKKYYNYSSSPNFLARVPRKYVFLLNEDEYENTKRTESAKNSEFSSEGKRSRRDKIICARIIDFVKSEHNIDQKELALAIGEAPSVISKIHVWAKDHDLLV